MSEGERIAMTPHLGRELIEALGLPKNTTEVTLHFAAGEHVTVQCKYFPEAQGVRRLLPRLAQWELVEKREEKAASV